MRGSMSKPENFDGIYLSLRGQLARIVSRIVPPKDIEDIVQETYVRLCQVKKKEAIKEPRSFMVTTARNLALDHLKRAETRLATNVSENEELGFCNAENLVDTTFQQVNSNQEFIFFCEAVRQLPVQCRRVFVLKKVYGYSQKEVARELGISESAVEKHIALGIKRCTHLMIQRERKAGVSGKSKTTHREITNE